jgi:hypothetical protein
MATMMLKATILINLSMERGLACLKESGRYTAGDLSTRHCLFEIETEHWMIL